MLGEDPGGLGRGRGPLPTGEVVKDVGEWLLSREVAGARSKGKRDQERKERKEGAKY
jgi:hypothetical protein